MPRSRPFRFVYLVSGNGAVFAEVLRAIDAGVLPVEITGVIADRPCAAAERGRQRGLRTRIIDAQHMPREEFDRAVADAIAEHQPDGLALNCNRLLPPYVTAAYPNRILNPHYSLLPLFPGFNPFRRAAASGMRVAGVTVHLVDDSVDGGPIVAQAVQAVPPGISAEALGDLVYPLGPPLFIQALRFLAEGRIDVAGRQAAVKGADYSGLPFVPALEPDIALIAERLRHQPA